MTDIDAQWIMNAVNTTTTLDPTLNPTDSPTHSPTLNPTNSPTLSPTMSPTQSPTTSPTKSPTDSPTKSPTDSPTQSPTNSPTVNPTSSPTAFYPMKVESLWIGYLNTEHVFGRNQSYIVTATSEGNIGRLHILLNSDDINLAKRATKSNVMWLKNVTWNDEQNEIDRYLPNECKSVPINTPTMSPTASPTLHPSKSPTDSSNGLDDGARCSLPQSMIIIYVILVTFFLFLLFCWYARKNSLISKMIAGNEQSIGMSYNNYMHGHMNQAYAARHNGMMYKYPMRTEHRQHPNRKMSDKYVRNDSDVEDECYFEKHKHTKVRGMSNVEIESKSKAKVKKYAAMDRMDSDDSYQQ